MPEPAAELRIIPVDGIGEIAEGTDLAALIAPEVERGDVVAITSKVVSKAEGRVVTGDRAEAVAAETVRVVARRGPTSIVENHLGLVMAAAGVDASNVEPGRLVLLPLDPDGTARELRDEVARRTGHNIAVIVTDTAGRPWREGQTDLAIGAAGIAPLESYAGREDRHGNELAVTAPAVADEIAAAAELASGKLGGRPVVVVRGLGDRVLPPGDHGPGARSLIRQPDADLFGLGSREAVLAALVRRDRTGFGAPATRDDMVDALARCGFDATATGDTVTVDTGFGERLAVLAYAMGWRPADDSSDTPPTRLVPLP